MSKKRIEKFIPIAIEAIDKYILQSDNLIPSEYKGYISSFGAGIIQAGLLPTVCFYEKEESGSSADKRLLMKAIHYIIKKEEESSEIEAVEANTQLNKYIIEKGNNNELKEEIIDASIALKLALRTYNFKDSKTGNKGE